MARRMLQDVTMASNDGRDLTGLVIVGGRA